MSMGSENHVAQAVQYILYENDAVEISYANGLCFQMSPCGTTFICQQRTALSGSHNLPVESWSGVQQRTQFATSYFQHQVCDAIEFRNRFAERPFLCRELINPEDLIKCHADVFDVSWPACVNDAHFLVFRDGSAQLSSVSQHGNQMASVWLMPTQRSFTVRYLAKMGRSAALQKDSSRSCLSNSENRFDTITDQQKSEPLVRSSPADMLSSQKHTSFLSKQNNSHNSSRGSAVNDSLESSPKNCSSTRDIAKTCDAEVASIFGVPSMEYVWIIQHHSMSCYPEFWRHPVQLLVEFCQTKEYHSRLALCLAGKREEDIVISDKQLGMTVSSEIPKSLPLKCLAPHLHRWNPSTSNDPCDYFHEKVKIICISGTVYRLLWNCQPKAVEIHPPDGSFIRSVGHSGHHFVHYIFEPKSQKIEERTYSSLTPAPLSTNQSYSVSRLVAMASRFLGLMSSRCVDLLTSNQLACWKTEAASPQPRTKLVLNVCPLEECLVPEVGRFSAFTDGSLRIVFHDRTCLDMRGLTWESHVYERTLQDLSSDEIESYVHYLKLNRSSGEFPDGVCRLLLPSGHYQHVDILKPQSIYERYVALALEWAMWVNTPLNQRHAFYDSVLYEPRKLADIELRKIKCFSHILDRVIGEPDGIETDISSSDRQPAGCSIPSPLTSRLSLQCNSLYDAAAVAQSVAEQALMQSSAMLQELDLFLAASTYEKKDS